MAHPMLDLVRRLVTGVEIPPDARIGAALRTDDGVIPVHVIEAGLEGITIVARGEQPPRAHGVLTIMVESMARIDLPVTLRFREDGAVDARPTGTPLVLRRRVTANTLLAQALGTAA
jgi:hypothetical protein